MKIVFDSNVIIAAFASRGLCNELFELCVAEHEIFISDYIIEECRQKLHHKIKLPFPIIDDIIGYLKSETEIVTFQSISKNICRDEKDLPVIGTAIASESDIIVSGDKHLLEIKLHNKIQILSPRQLWDYLRL